MLIQDTYQYGQEGEDCKFLKMKNKTYVIEKSFQNPVLTMLFYDKYGKVDVKTEDDLRGIDHSKLYEKHKCPLQVRDKHSIIY